MMVGKAGGQRSGGIPTERAWSLRNGGPHNHFCQGGDLAGIFNGLFHRNPVDHGVLWYHDHYSKGSLKSRMHDDLIWEVIWELSLTSSSGHIVLT